jgi:hypothetical protein
MKTQYCQMCNRNNISFGNDTIKLTGSQECRFILNAQINSESLTNLQRKYVST